MVFAQTRYSLQNQNLYNVYQEITLLRNDIFMIYSIKAKQVLITPVKHLGQYFHLLTSQKNVQMVFTQGSKKYLIPKPTYQVIINIVFLLCKICTKDTHFDCPPKNPYSLHLLTVHEFIDLLPFIKLLTDSLIFIGSASHVILTSQQSFRFLDNKCEWKHFLFK